MKETDPNFDPWATSIHGIKPMSDEERAFWERFDDLIIGRHGYGWSVGLDMTPDPDQRQAREMVQIAAQESARQSTDLAVEILTGKR